MWHRWSTPVSISRSIEGDTVVLDPATFTDAGTLDTHTADDRLG